MALVGGGVGGRFVRSTCYATGFVLTGLVSLGFPAPSISPLASEREPATRIPSPSSAAASQKTVLTWVGCGIAKTAFMVELAATYADKTGIEIKLKGGGATRGIRDLNFSEYTISIITSTPPVRGVDPREGRPSAPG